MKLTENIFCALLILVLSSSLLLAQDSIVVITAQGNGLNLVSPADFPESGGTFWMVNSNGVNAPWPCPPQDASLPVFGVTDSQFLVDATGGQVTTDPDQSVADALAGLADDVQNLISQIQGTVPSRNLSRGGAHAMDLPGPGDGGDGGDTNGDYTPPGVPEITFTTNQLWLQILAKTNTTAYLWIHPPWNVTNGVYDLLYTTNLTAPITWQWVLRTDPGQTNLVVSNAVDGVGFYALGEPNDLLANDSLGTNFWLAFMSTYSFYDQNLSLYISSPVGATGTVTLPVLGITTNFTVAAGGVTNVAVDESGIIQSYEYDTVENYGIHVTASAPVSVYALSYVAATSVAFNCYPKPLLRTNYCLMARPSLSGDESEFAIVGTETNTTVSITPPIGGPLFGIMDDYTTNYTINLDQGQTYQIFSDESYSGDVTGTWIDSDKPVAVFAGDGLAYVPDAVTAAGNPLIQEQLPVETWGKQALSIGFAGRTNGDSYRILAAYSNTVVTITGAVVTIMDESSSPWTVTITNETVMATLTNAGQFYDIIIQGPAQFQASQPIQVAQFANGDDFDSAPYGDPCEFLLPPTGHYLGTNIVVALPNDNVTGDFNTNYLNLIVAQSGISTTLLNGMSVALTNFIAIGSSGYYGAQIPVTNAVNTVSSLQPIEVQVYGWGIFDAYSYFGGIVK
jgi:hypothetical protein